ncbi:MAG TPA: hypothetical protein VFH27_14690, partial [Longimicrobiaceae bacterium]|nr:hypothetical protein [Longimicrobiaceae bacterium]
PSFSILPAVASRLFVQLLKIESQLLRNRVLCLQFHPHSFNPSSTHRHWKPTKVSVRSFLPTRDGGLMFKHFLRRNNPKATAASTDGVLRLLRAHRCLAMSEIGTAVRSAAGGELPSRPT